MNNEFAFSEILDTVVAESGVEKREAQAVLEAFFLKLPTAVAEHGRVDLSGKGFGVFRLEARAADSGVYPSPNGAGGFDMLPWGKPERDEIVFRPSPGFTTGVAIVTGKPCI